MPFSYSDICLRHRLFRNLPSADNEDIQIVPILGDCDNSELGARYILMRQMSKAFFGDPDCVSTPLRFIQNGVEGGKFVKKPNSKYLIIVFSTHGDEAGFAHSAVGVLDSTSPFNAKMKKL